MATYRQLVASYVGNPSYGIVGKPNRGRKIPYDDYGVSTYEQFLVEDDFGNLYDPRYNVPDRDPRKDNNQP